MDSNFIPSLREFKLLVNAFNFNQSDIDLQSTIAIEVGYNSMEHYLEFVYFTFTKAFNMDAFIEATGKTYNETQSLKFKRSQISEHYDESFLEELEPMQARVQKLPAKIIARISQFEKKLSNLFFVSLIEKNTENVPAIKFLRSFLIDLSKQVSLTDPEQGQEYQKAIDLIDGMMMSQTNLEIQSQISHNYYFPENAILLEQLYIELVQLNYIAPHEDLKKTFESKIKQSSEERILWLTDLPKLLYLLYRLNNKKEFVNGERIDVIAGNLFKFKTEKTSANIRTNYNKVITSFNEESYLSKKMSDLKNLLDNLIK